MRILTKVPKYPTSKYPNTYPPKYPTSKYPNTYPSKYPNTKYPNALMPKHLNTHTSKYPNARTHSWCIHIPNIQLSILSCTCTQYPYVHVPMYPNIHTCVLKYHMYMYQNTIHTCMYSTINLYMYFVYRACEWLHTSGYHVCYCEGQNSLSNHLAKIVY